MSRYWVRAIGERPGRPGLQVRVMVRQMILAGFVVFLPAGMHGQGRGMMASIPRAAVGPRVAMPAPNVGAVRAMPVARTGVRGGTARLRTVAPTVRSTRSQISTRRRFDNLESRRRPDCGTAPGLGFDAVHQAATCGSGSFGRQGFGAAGGFFFPIFDGGFPVSGSSVSGDEGSVAESAQPDVTDAELRGRGRRYRASEPETAPTPAAESPSGTPAEDDPFVFVRRDGTVFFAVAYSWEKGSLRYITSEGLRRVVTQDALDLDATRQFNEQRGLNFRSPA